MDIASVIFFLWLWQNAQSVKAVQLTGNMSALTAWYGRVIH